MLSGTLPTICSFDARQVLLSCPSGLSGVCPALIQCCARFPVWEALGVWRGAPFIYQEKEQ